MTELTFLVEASPEGGFTARAVGDSLFTEADTMPELHEMIRDTVACPFDAGQAPKSLRLLEP